MGKAPDFLRGIFAAIPTPFTDDGDLSLDNLERNVKMWLISPLNGFLALGSTGEFAHLTFDEKLEVIEATVRASEERPVIAGTGANATRETVALTLAAADLGADAVMVVTPFYYGKRLDAAALRDHYETVADASPVPVLLYNIPQLTGVDLPVELVSELAQHPNIVGIKDSSGNLPKLGRLIDETPDGFAVFTGAAELLYPALNLGAAGAILALANVAPWECCEVLQLWQDGRHEEAVALQRRLNAVSRVVERYGIGGIKGLLRLVGYYGGPPRPPLRAIDEEDLDQIRAVLKEVRMLGC